MMTTRMKAISVRMVRRHTRNAKEVDIAAYGNSLVVEVGGEERSWYVY